MLPLRLEDEEMVRVVGGGCSPLLLPSHVHHKGLGERIRKT